MSSERERECLEAALVRGVGLAAETSKAPPLGGAMS